MPTTTRLALQGDLLSLLGFGALELIATVLPERVRVKDDLKRLLAAAEHAEADGSSSGGLGGSGGAGGGPAAPVGCMVKLTTKSQQVLEKQRRKDATRLAKEKRRAALEETRSPDEIAAELEWLSAAGFEPATKLLRQEEETKLAKPLAPDSALAQLRSLASISGLGKALPEGTVRRTGKGWEEVQVPPAQTTKLEQRLVQISELPEHAQLAFRGVHALNALQSAVVGVALHSNENMLVCAPTGAGKTNVALLAMMQQVRVCCPDGGRWRGGKGGRRGRGGGVGQGDGDEVGEDDPACF